MSTRKLHFGCGGALSSSLLSADTKKQANKTTIGKKSLKQDDKSKLKK
jgi:hypothetical protein